MDKDHRLDAPNNESLRAIEQLDNHGELGSLYRGAHDEWEGSNLLSREAREEKRDLEQLRISLSIRKWFAVIGLLTPLPFVLGSILFTLAITFIQVDNIAFVMLPSLLLLATWLYVSYRAIKRVYNIFYEHSMRATPFFVTLLGLLLLSLQGLYVTMLALYNDSMIYNSIITGVVVLATSVAYSGILVFIWTSQQLSAGYKVGCLGIFAGIITLVTLLVNMF